MGTYGCFGGFFVTFLLIFMDKHQGAAIMKSSEKSEVVAMAWADEVPFSAIFDQFGLDEAAVIKLMRHELKPSSFQLWRKRVTGRKAKHFGLQNQPPIAKGVEDQTE